MGWPWLTKQTMRDCGQNSVLTSDVPLPTRPLNNGHTGSWPIAPWVARQLMNMWHNSSTCCRRPDGIAPRKDPFPVQKGLDRKIHLRILQKEPMLVETLDTWKEAARREVERQAFIDASLGPREFCAPWNNKKDQKWDRQGRWRKGVPYQKSDRDLDVMEVNVVCALDSTDPNTWEKQCSEGRCFLCNKQGHLKRNCPSQEKRGSPSKVLYSPPTARLAQVEENKTDDTKTLVDKMMGQDWTEVMTKLRKMNLEEWDEIIDALINQEGF